MGVVVLGWGKCWGTGFIVPFVNHIVLFFLFAFNLFYSFTFLLFGRHALRIGSVERPARNHLCAAPFHVYPWKLYHK